MTTYISDRLSSLDIKITPDKIAKIENFLISFEVKSALGLNTPLLGVNRIYFAETDRALFFEIFGVNEKQVMKVIQTIPSVDTRHKVGSDAFNILCVWVMHLSYRDISENNPRHAFLFDIAKILHYKYFTSLVSYYFSHGANPKIMAHVINNLTRKFDIVQYGTWRLTIEARCKDLIDEEDSIHHRSLKEAYDDTLFLYIITDTQTRLRDKIKNIMGPYYQAKESGSYINDRSATMTNSEGDKIVVASTSVFDIVISSLTTEILSINVFVDRILVNNIAKQFSNISADMLRGSLESLSHLATTQSVSGDLDKVIKIDNEDVYVGMRIFITNLIQRSFRYCIHNHIDLTRHAEVYIRIKNVYASSRIADTDILDVKRSLIWQIDNIGRSKRETTKSSLRLAVLLYFITKALNVM